MRYFIKSRNKGFTLLETIFSLLISAILICSTIYIYKLEFNDFYNAKKTFHKIYISSKVNQLTRKILTDFDSHPFLILPIIHKNDVIYNDKSVSNISKRKDDLKNNEGSNAISYFKLDLQNLLKTSYYEKGVFYLCPFFKKKAKTADFRTYLAFTSENMFEVSLNLTKDGDCFISKIKNQISIITPYFDMNEKVKFLFFIPIEQTYTIYHAKNKTLRFVTHENGNILENQPIAQNIYSINFELQDTKDDFLNLKSYIQVFEKDKRKIKISNENLFKKQDLFNFVLYINEFKNDI